jgi:hypothetical protein
MKNKFEQRSKRAILFEKYCIAQAHVIYVYNFFLKIKFGVPPRGKTSLVFFSYGRKCIFIMKYTYTHIDINTFFLCRQWENHHPVPTPFDANAQSTKANKPRLKCRRYQVVDKPSSAAQPSTLLTAHQNITLMALSSTHGPEKDMALSRF